ncbi:MAG TPA: hypothetical protein VMG60_00515 [Burkholderiaceae bacterium]|nr:hypothetical protein [Burkholderiaceae bacterium]
MKPSKSILDESFAYVPSTTTDVCATWRRFGWRPITDEERRLRRGVSVDDPAQPAAELKLSLVA